MWVINLVLLAALAYLLALSVNAKIQGQVTSPNAQASQNYFPAETNKQTNNNRNIPLSSYEVIVKRNIFGLPDPAGEAAAVASTNPEDLPESNLNLVLLGTIINADQKSVAIIKNDDNSKVNGYKSGDEIDIIPSEKVSLVDVNNCKAVIQRRSTKQETIKCKNLGDIASAKSSSKLPNTRASSTNKKKEDNSNKQISKLSENEYEVERELLEDLLSDPTKIVQQARVIPQDDGLRFFGIRSNSIFWKIGIKNGDTLHRINNVELNDIERALGVFEELRDQNSFTIELTRAGQKYTYEYSVK
ncbi:MAG: type II secretion system protein GspC [Thermodesulfobacteriota bacterium]